MDQSVFSKSESVIQENLDSSTNLSTNDINNKLKKDGLENNKKIINSINKYQNKPLVFENKISNSFFVSTLDKVEINNDLKGFIIVTEEANDILFAVEERKNFIIRTVLAVALVILIFSLF